MEDEGAVWSQATGTDQSAHPIMVSPNVSAGKFKEKHSGFLGAGKLQITVWKYSHTVFLHVIITEHYS